ncbi:restriction endonuclease subunit S, partial [Levilactobacillus brevis]
FFQQLDKTIALHQRKLTKLKELKQGYLQKMFPKNGSKFPQLRFAGFADAWEQRKLIEVADYRNGKAHEKDISENGDYIVVNSKFVSTNGAVKKFSDELIAPLKKGELAFVLSDVPNGRAIARTFLIDEDNKYSLNQRIAGITPHSDTNSYFLHSLMNRHHYFLRFDDGAGQTNLSKKEVENWTELYPSIEEQDKIGSFFKQLDDTITLHQRKLEKLQELKKGYLQKMFC